jgi:hypothetical protein
VLEGCGHVPQVERPEETIALLQGFFSDVGTLGMLPRRARAAA